MDEFGFDDAALASFDMDAAVAAATGATGAGLCGKLEPCRACVPVSVDPSGRFCVRMSLTVCLSVRCRRSGEGWPAADLAADLPARRAG